jgi:hypothetical protein
MNEWLSPEISVSILRNNLELRVLFPENLVYKYIIRNNLESSYLLHNSFSLFQGMAAGTEYIPFPEPSLSPFPILYISYDQWAYLYEGPTLNISGIMSN